MRSDSEIMELTVINVSERSAVERSMAAIAYLESKTTRADGLQLPHSLHCIKEQHITARKCL